MTNQERLELIAPCGIDCAICKLHTCKNDRDVYKYLLSKGIPEKSLPCEGCRKIDGNCPIMQKTCKNFTCVSEKEHSFCFECQDFPCNNIHPSSDRANVLPQNLKVYNLCRIKNIGLQQFVETSLEIQHRYFNGKMQIGNGPQL